jgi:hypothetical protein
MAACYALPIRRLMAGVKILNAGLTAQPNAALLDLARRVLQVQLADCEKAEPHFKRAEPLDPGQSLSTTALGLVAGDKNQEPEPALANLRSKPAARPEGLQRCQSLGPFGGIAL